ncbi:beta-defensin 29-like [Erinaceus europaeus]|uniref:Beta-defensin n=1 Tax=Erinaceus europaeus TaxID=9365 RepID=A0ABM3Y9L3_ERIEU|nr:beta-defensin 29-like [Erinaceus europaeus]
MRPYLATTVLLLILIHQTSGSLKKSPPKLRMINTVATCEDGKGYCRNRCRQDENELYNCAAAQKCCINSASTRLYEVDSGEWSSFASTTSQPSY